jgi:hypothetical protein
VENVDKVCVKCAYNQLTKISYATANLYAEKAPTHEGSWFFGSHGNEGRSQDPLSPPRQGAKKAYGFA